MRKEDARKLLSLDSTIDITKIEIKKEGGRTVKYIYIKSQKKKAKCPKCNNFSNKIHDYLKPSKLTYLKTAEEETKLIVSKRRFYCRTCNKSFTEDLGVSGKGNSISDKTKQLILKECLDKNKTVKDIARDCGVSSGIVRKTFLDAMKNYPDHVETLPEVISFDETSTYTEKGTYSFILNDPIHKETLDILPSRKKDYLIKYFKKVKNRESIKVVICDLYMPYYVVTKICFPEATFVSDPFHYTTYVEDGLDKVRLRLVHKYEKDPKCKEYKLLKNRVSKKLLLKSFYETKEELEKKKKQEQRLKEGKKRVKIKDKFKDFWYGKIKVKKNDIYVPVTRLDRLNEILSIDDDLSEAYNLKEEFLRITINVKYEDARSQIEKWIDKCNESQISEMINAAKTIKDWLDPIVNSFKDRRYSNGFTEANNNVIDKIISTAYGYKNFKFFRLRTLAILHHGFAGGSRKNIEKGKIKK